MRATGTVKIGYAPTKRDCFNHPEAMAVRDQILEKIGTLGVDIVTVALPNASAMLESVCDIEPTVKAFRDAQVDGVFFPHCNFGAESMVARVAQALGVPVLLWGPRDGMPGANEGRTRDTQCGLFATGKVLRRMNVPFTYLPNSALDDASFVEGFKSFAAVCGVVRSFRTLRVLQVSVRPEPFWTVMYNEGELLERFGVQVYPVTFPDVEKEIRRLEAGDDRAVQDAFLDYKARLNCAPATDEQLIKMARLMVAIKNLCAAHQCSCVAVQCWGPIQYATGAATCTINGFLTEMGLPVACETDVHGAISSILLQAAAHHARTVFFADLTIRHPDNDNAELLWHCGNFPPSLAIDAKARPLSMIASDDGCFASQSNWEIRHGDVTVCRFDGDHGAYKLMMGEGEGVDGPKTTGTYLWFQVDNWPKWEKHLVEGPYIHHVTGIHGRLAHILYEACKYLGVQADPISPSADQLEARWLSGAR